MGVVYKAQDTKPERSVALMFQRAAFTSPEELLRFQLDAKAVSALNHSSIAIIPPPILVDPSFRRHEPRLIPGCPSPTAAGRNLLPGSAPSIPKIQT